MNRNDEEYLVEVSEIESRCDEELSRDEAESSVIHDDFLAELEKIGNEHERKVVIGQRYYVIEHGSSPVPIRIRAFTVTAQGPGLNLWEGELALDGSDLSDEEWANVSKEVREEIVRPGQAGKWSVKCVRSVGALHDSHQEARTIATSRIEQQCSELESTLEYLRTVEEALHKWDGVLCEPTFGQ